jgi:multicomponent Na+:H+ antiporter subunit E
MRLFILNIALAMIWSLMQGALEMGSFLTGMFLGYLIIGACQRALGSKGYALGAYKVVELVLVAVWEIIYASLQLAVLVLLPRLNIRPAVVALDLEVTSDLQIVTLANLITLSPGTAALDLSADRRTLFIHTITLDDREKFRRRIKDRLERRILEVIP